jgi:hypothetical protein
MEIRGSGLMKKEGEEGNGNAVDVWPELVTGQNI